MLSPGDVVFLDGEEKKGLKGKRHRVVEAKRAGDLNLPAKDGARCFYQFEGSDEWIPSGRITAHWVET